MMQPVFFFWGGGGKGWGEDGNQILEGNHQTSVLGGNVCVWIDEMCDVCVCVFFIGCSLSLFF